MKIKAALIWKQQIKALRWDQMYEKDKSLIYFTHSNDLALLFLAPILAMHNWFLLAQAEFKEITME